jgi:dTDP-4-amino-4,6-dideoxygalactose transaminase
VPVPVDVSEADYCADADAVAAAITRRTRAIMPVHLYGQLANMRALQDVAARQGLAVVEDACQAHGAVRDGITAGAGGDAAAFSFYPGKNLGAFGDAGALTTDDGDLAQHVRALREHGQERKYEHDVVGWTARLDTMQALVLQQKLPLLDSWNAERRRVAAAYSDGLTGIGDLVLPRGHGDHVWHLYVVRTAEPQRLAAFLAERGIGTGRHYPEPPHLTGAYSHLGHAAGAFPIAEGLARECLSLPIFPGMTDAQVAAVVESVQIWFRGG